LRAGGTEGTGFARHRDVGALLPPAGQVGRRHEPRENAPTFGVMGVEVERAWPVVAKFFTAGRRHTTAHHGIRVRGNAPHTNQTNDRPPGLIRLSIAIRRRSGAAALFCRFPKYFRLLILKPADLSLKILPGL
jgi:hypothetical protein